MTNIILMGVVAFIYSFLIYRRNKYALAMHVIIAFDGYGMYDGDTFLSVPGLVKTSDLFLLSLTIFTIIRWQMVKRTIQSSENRFLIYIPLTFIVFLFVSTFQHYFSSELSLFECFKGYRLSLSYLTIVLLFHLRINQRDVANFIKLNSILAIFAMLFLRSFPGLLSHPQVYISSREIAGIYLPVTFIPGFTMIVLGFIYAGIVSTINGGFKRYISPILFFFGMVIQGQRMYLFGAPISLSIVIIISALRTTSKSLFLRMGIIFVALIFMFNITPIKRMIKLTYTAIVQVDDTFLSRVRNNEYRWYLVSQQPIIGYGVIDKDSALYRKISGDGGTSQSYTTTDSGYLDLLIKLGVLGAAAVTISIIGVLLMLINRGYIKRLKTEAWVAPTLFTYLILCVITSITHSPFTSAYGQIPLSILIGSSIMQKQRIEDY